MKLDNRDLENKHTTYKDFIILLVLFTFLCILYGYPKIFFEGPYSIHQWRQADCLSFARNYTYETSNLLKPSVLWLGHTADGKTVSEFPVIYYMVGMLWRLFGQHEYIFRIVSLIILFTCVFSLFRIAVLKLGDRFYAYFIAIILFTSPLIIYYGYNFLMNVPALCFALTAWYNYELYCIYRKSKYLILTGVFFVLAGVLKITSLFIFGAIYIVEFFGFIGSLQKKDPYGRKSQLRLLLSGLLVLSLIGGWISWSRNYNSKNISGLFLQSIFAIWEIDSSQRSQIWEALTKLHLREVYNKGALIVLFVCMIFTWIRAKRLI